MNRPSMLGWIASPATLPGLTLPPYRTGGALRQNAAGDALDQRLLPVRVVSRRRNAVCADRPDGLVGEQDVPIQHLVLEELQGRPHLAGYNLLRLTRLALGQRLADADQRHQAVSDSGRGLQADGAIRLAEMLAPLAVAELDEVEPAIPQHQWRDLAGPGAGIRPVHVLRANLDPCRGQASALPRAPR